MKNYLLCIMLILFYGISNAQERTFQAVDSLVNFYAQDLLNNAEADKILIYKTGCIGCDIIGECSCKIGNIKSFLIWKEAAKSFFKEINCCEISDRKQSDLGAVWRELETKEKVIFNSKFQADRVNVHHDFYKIKLIRKECSQEIKMSDFYFDEDNNHQNENSKQAARKFQKLLESVLGN